MVKVEHAYGAMLHLVLVFAWTALRPRLLGAGLRVMPAMYTSLPDHSHIDVPSNAEALMYAM